MPSIRQRIADTLLGPEKARLQEAFYLMQRAYQSGPWELPPDELVRQLKEVDPWAIQDILWQQGWELLGGINTEAGLERERAVQESKQLYKSPLGQWQVWLWTGWGLGDKVSVIPEDPSAAEVWDEFWEADRNAHILAGDRIHELSNWLLLTGNRFLAFYASTLDGECTVRSILPEQIADIVCNPDDGAEAWFYKRQWNDGKAQRVLYYPDWQLFFSDKLETAWARLKETGGVPQNAERADEKNAGTLEQAGTVVCVLHLAFNHKEDDSLWGWPILTTARPWLRAHREFMEARLTVAAAKAMFVRRKRVQGGSRAVAAVRNTIASRLSQSQLIDTNPPAYAGSTEVENRAVETDDLPMTTGASDAKIDNEAFTWMALLGGGVFPTSAGLDTARWATALEMDKAQSMCFQRYQTYWSAQFGKMVVIVLSYAEKYGNTTFEDKTAQVSTDNFSLADFPGVAENIGRLVSQALTPLVQDGTFSPEAARLIATDLWRISLQALGISLPDEFYDALEEEPEPEPEPPPNPFMVPMAVPPEPEEPEAGTVEAIAREIARNAQAGGVAWENVARWALDTLVEGNGRDIS